MLYLCLSLMALLCAFPLALKAHNIHSLCVLYRVCYAGQNHPLLWWMCAQQPVGRFICCSCLPDPSGDKDDFLPTLWCSRWKLLLWCVWRRGCPTFKHFARFRDWPRGAVTQLPSSSNTRSLTSARCRANTGKKKSHTAPPLTCTYPRPGLPWSLVESVL